MSVRAEAFPGCRGLLWSRAKLLGEYMVKRSPILSFLVLLSILWPLSFARADQPFQRFLPLLVDLAGWEGKKPDGMSMQMSGVDMTTATREYARAPAKIVASVVIGKAAEGALAPMQSGLNMQTADGHIMTTTIRGMSALKTFNVKDKSGALMVQLGNAAMFSVSYNGLTEDEALALADKFDWKAIQAAALAK